MSSALAWNPLFPMVPLLLGALVVLASLLIIEWRRKQRFKAVRIASQLIIVASLFGLLARPSINVNRTAGPVLILTDGYNNSTIDSLSSAFPDLSIVGAAGIDASRAAKKISVRDLDSIAGNPLWIAGFGMPAYAVSDIRHGFEFIPSALPDGISDLAIPTQIVAGVPVLIRGSYRMSNDTHNSIRLLGPGGIEDSTTFTKAGTTPFEMTLLPEVAGPLMYTLAEVDSAGNVFRTSRLPIYARKESKLEILIVSDYPTFELRYLKNFLADKGHFISMRNRLSKNRYHQEFANRSTRSLNTLTSSLLATTDVLIIDQASYAGLTSSERKLLVQSSQSGLGIVFLPAAPSRSAQSLITFKELKNVRDTVRVKLGGAQVTLPALALSPVETTTSITLGEGDRVLAGCLCNGEVKVGFQLLRETYQLGLQGKPNTYSALWTPLLEKVAREHDTGFRISFFQQFPAFSNEPQSFTVTSSGARPGVIFDDIPLPTVEDVNIDGLWHGTVWADGNTWHTLEVDSTRAYFFDLPASEWTTLRITRQLKANEIHRGMAAQAATVIQRQSGTIVFLILFVLASGFLWLTPKI